MSKARFPLPAIEIFRRPRRREIISYFVARAREDCAEQGERGWYTLGDVRDTTGLSHESLRRELSASNEVLLLRELRLVRVRNPDAQIPHYQLAESPPADLLYEHPRWVDALSELLGEGETVRELVRYFLDQAEPGEFYTKYHLRNEAGITYQALRGAIPKLVENEFLLTQEGKRAEEYALNEGPIAAFLYELNDRLH